MNEEGCTGRLSGAQGLLDLYESLRCIESGTVKRRKQKANRPNFAQAERVQSTNFGFPWSFTRLPEIFQLAQLLRVPGANGIDVKAEVHDGDCSAAEDQLTTSEVEARQLTSLL